MSESGTRTTSLRLSLGRAEETAGARGVLHAGGDDPAGRQLPSLYSWLGDEDALRGQVRLRAGAPGPGQMGAALDVITVAVGSGGVAGVLARSVAHWFVQGRRADVKVTVAAEDGARVEVDVRRARDPEAVIRLVEDLVRRQSEGAADE